MNFQKHLLSINTYRQGPLRERVISIFGIKFKFIRIKKTLSNLQKETDGILERIKEYPANVDFNKNFINTILIARTDADLMYIKVGVILIIFSPKIFKADPQIVNDFLLVHAGSLLFFNIRILPKTSRLYKEHINAFKNNNILFYKYACRWGRIISQSIMTYGKDETELFIEGKYLGLENYPNTTGIRFYNTPRRPIYHGNTLNDYLTGKSDEEQKEIIKSFFDWFFKKYDAGNGKIKGQFADCHFNNCIISHGKFIFIDNDVGYDDIEKSWCLWFALCNGEHQLYDYFANLYGLQKHSINDTYPMFIGANSTDLQNAAKLNQKLYEHYFSESGLAPNSAE